MDDLSVRTVGVCVLLTWSLSACTSTRTDPVRPSPNWPLAQSEETSDPGEPTLRTFHHEDFPVDEHLATEVRTGCAKHGPVAAVRITMEDGGAEHELQVLVAVEFERLDAAARARAALHQRWFDGRQVVAQLLPATGKPHS